MYYVSCYCPRDYFGNRCEFWNKVQCDFSQAELKCPKFDSEYFVSKYGGVRPCKFVGKNENFDLKFFISCFRLHSPIHRFKVENCSHYNKDEISKPEGLKYDTDDGKSNIGPVENLTSMDPNVPNISNFTFDYQVSSDEN